MMESFVDFVSRLIYATAGEALITPNHDDWLSTHSTPTGLEWITHHLDSMLPAYESWLSTNNLPPLMAWNGADTRPWDVGEEHPMAGEPLEDPSTIASLEFLGQEFQNRYGILSASEISGLFKAPFSYRFWGYLKFCSDIRRGYEGEVVIPATIVYDRDGTILSPVSFCNTYNSMHGNWHGANNATGTNSQLTPGFESSAGQTTSGGGIGQGSGEEFIKFHHDHTELFSRWLSRTGQLPVKPINLYNGGSGWPAPGAGNPSTWIEDLNDLWINDSNGDTDTELLDIIGDVDALGIAMNNSTPTVDRLGNPVSLSSTAIHGSGHGANSDIGSLAHNNFTSRFHAWHGWIDTQWYWRKPRFGYYDNSAKQREKIFVPVDFSGGAVWPGMKALTVVRDLLLASDELSPANAVSGLNFTTGAGVLRMKFRVEDSYDRQLTMRLKAEVFDDGGGTVLETIPEVTHTYLVGNTGAGDDFDRDTDFTVDFSFATAFQSDDPTRANPAVGFVANRIRISGSLTVADGSDPDFVETDYLDIDLIQEKEGADIDLYLNLSSFGEDQVVSAQTLVTSGEALFTDAFYVVVQDRTSDANPVDWAANPDVDPLVHGLIEGFTPASGLFEDAAHAPEVVLWDPVTATPVTGVRVELSSGPLQEDPGLADNFPQRFTYSYNIIFETSNGAFTGLATNTDRFVELRVNTADRSGNGSDTMAPVKFFNEANPYMTDGATSWISIDTRVFHMMEGDTRFGETLGAGTDSNTLVQQFISKLNTGVGLGGDTFDGLPTNQSESALLPFETITDQTTGTSKVVQNFALAKVRLQGNLGATNVRAFFRLFRFSAASLVFDASTHYRTHDTGTGVKVPLLGYTGATASDEVVSIPFFAESRVATTTDMTTQTDPPNAQDFPAGILTEQVLYFGVYLDINQSSVRFPSDYMTAHPNGGFTGGDPTQSLPTLMMDHHQCMVVEVNYDGDATSTGDAPAGSDNLAQRNLLILTSDNPGAPITHTVEHSFEMDLGKRRIIKHKEKEDLEHRKREENQVGDFVLPNLNFISPGNWQKRLKEEALGLAMNSPTNTMMMWKKFLPQAEKLLRQRRPLVFDPAKWTNSSEWTDELMIRWNELPRNCVARVYLPTINCEHIINLRNLRHAPGDVQIVDSHTLLVNTEQVTYLPVPPLKRKKIAGVITIELPEGVKKGQEWKVDVIHIRGGERRVLGGFQIDIQVKNAKDIYANEGRFLKHVFDQWTLLEPTHRWHPVLKHRVKTMRLRARALAESAGVQWRDPTVFKDKEFPGGLRPIEGQKMRVVLEKIQILDDLDTFIKGKGELFFQSHVYSANNGGQSQKHRLPEKGAHKISDKKGQNVLELEKVIFKGYVKDDLRIEILGTELDCFDPNDILGKYTRLFNQKIQSVYGLYGPDQEVIDPENMISWKVWYRIERG